VPRADAKDRRGTTAESVPMHDEVRVWHVPARSLLRDLVGDAHSRSTLPQGSTRMRRSHLQRRTAAGNPEWFLLKKSSSVFRHARNQGED